MYYVPSYYDNDYSYYPVDRYEMLRRQKAHDQARRQAAERRRREELLRRRLYEEELARQEREEARYYAEQERLRKARVENEDEYVVVRGPGGYRYRVSRSELEDRQKRLTGKSASKPAVNSSREKTIRKERNYENFIAEKENSSDIQRTQAKGPKALADATSFLSTKTSETKKSKRKTKIAVIVEDVSDSEQDDDELNSFWRNRHPGPGESWIEPVNGTV